MPEPTSQPTKRAAVLSHALDTSLFRKLRGKRIVLASASPRRADILRTYGLAPEVVSSTFPEELPHTDYEDAGQYAVATGCAKALEVYEKLVESDPEDPPDLVIGADTIVVLSPPDRTILEKPKSKLEQMAMLMDYNGSFVDVITGVTVVQPQLAMPGYSLASLTVSTRVDFAECEPELLEAYVESGEGIDRAGGFAIQGLGGLLIRKVTGDYNNCVGFPGQAFFNWLRELDEDGKLFEM